MTPFGLAGNAQRLLSQHLPPASPTRGGATSPGDTTPTRRARCARPASCAGQGRRSGHVETRQAGRGLMGISTAPAAGVRPRHTAARTWPDAWRVPATPGRSSSTSHQQPEEPQRHQHHDHHGHQVDDALHRGRMRLQHGPHDVPNHHHQQERKRETRSRPGLIIVASRSASQDGARSTLSGDGPLMFGRGGLARFDRHVDIALTPQRGPTRARSAG